MVALDFTPAEEESFKATFRLRRRLLKALSLPLGASLLVLLLEVAGRSHLTIRLGLPDWTFLGGALAVAVITAGVTAWAWRCPACRRFLDPAPKPSYCRRCGCPLS